MSWKGFQKGVTRAPQTFKQKFNIGELTKDPIYVDAERRFEELEQETKRLKDNSERYTGAINSMLNHQIEFSKACAELYKPISGRMSDPDSFVQEGNPEGIRACEEYESIVRDLQETLKPELEMIEARVIKPADELLEIIKLVQKTANKRDHKQLDYDRRRATLKKLQEKKDKTLKDEKALYKAENDVEQATQDFNYFNDLLKTELPQLFRFERDFISPLFQSFYYMQLNVFYTLHEKMQSIDIGYFDLALDIEGAFAKKRGDVQEQAEKLSIVRPKAAAGKPKPGISKYVSKYAKNPTSSSASTANPEDGIDNPPPPYSPVTHSSLSSPSGHLAPPGAATGSTPLSTAAAGKAKPPPPKPKPRRLSGAPPPETVTALYDYEAQAEGDLSFLTGDVIEIIQRSENSNEWWTGKLNGKQGKFPGNYVQLKS
ncbi:BAR-domain-containing protein [Eremomyces bilateralis CBS 781.70]|uniref:BAR-domain-containing protein n=1 Tax=Eremomyces bilateralis CBS 781.70 TaxID=1392243 RepID=A0A6G1GBF9_9PEZI|nr:BAR-domain-containing protein [Eremomyces bilateralis CBS 781.70]KAF1815240.1 BAR-domain-containing protein [Eremomyces bilateralis CBS 781.70]